MRKTKNQPLFTPVTRGRASEEIALQIEVAIINGHILTGDKLPSERDLQARFGTGRGAVREALRTLEQKGLVEIKKGAQGGAFAKQVDVANVSESLALFLKQNNVDPKNLIEFRESIDRTITVLAITNSSSREKKQLVAMTRQLEKFLEQESPDLESMVELDRELNIRLSKMSGNPIFHWVMQAIQLGFSSHDFSLYKEPHFREATIANWLETAREIQACDTQTALSLVSHHYLLLRRCLGNARVMDKGADLSSQAG